MHFLSGRRAVWPAIRAAFNQTRGGMMTRKSKVATFTPSEMLLLKAAEALRVRVPHTESMQRELTYLALDLRMDRLAGEGLQDRLGRMKRERGEA
jgi:hypothetical protein